MYISKFFTPIQNLAEQFNWLQSALASSEKVFSIMDIQPQMVDAPDAVELDEVKGDIEFRDVWFSYIPGEWVLQGVSLPTQAWAITIGQMRVPFTVDAHRSPHQQYFANRSFIAKQVGNVRDVGAAMSYKMNVGVPIILEAGLFNGSGLTGQKDYWTKSVNFSSKAQVFLPHGFNVTLSMQKIRPDHIGIMMYDAATYYHSHGWHLEAEYLYKHYSHEAFSSVHAADVFASYDIRMGSGALKYITPLVRYDFMSDHSDGYRYLDGEKNENGVLKISDYKRSRLTGGLTFSFAKPFVSDIRLNFEKYFYRSGAIAKPSERDKIVVEVMTRF